MLDKQPGERLKNLFDGSLSLQGETYEFIGRTIAMDQSLKDAHSLLQDNPQVQADELYQAWQPGLKQAYRNMFAVFLRPYHLVAFPFSGAAQPGLQRDSESQFGFGNSPFSAWSEAGAGFLKGFSEAMGTPAGGVSRSNDAGQPFKGISDTASLNPAGQIAEEQIRAYFQSAKQFFGVLGEDQFLFPKDLVIHLQRVCDTYPEVYPLSQKYETMLWSTWDGGLKKLASQVTGKERPVEFKEFFDSYVRLMTGEFDRLLCSPEFLEVQNGFTETISDLIVSLRKAIEARLEMFPFLPFVTSTEMVGLEKTVYTQKRQISSLERRIADLEDRLGTPA